jgi:hypothetical protein
MQQSETVGALAAALAKAQGEMENATKNAKNPHFKSNYADLAEILNTARPVLARHGIAVVQSPSYEGGEVQLATTLMHTSGEWVRGFASAPATKQDPQGIGSAVTYLRRYALAAFVGIAQEDDDGQAASRPRPPYAEAVREPEPAAEAMATTDQVDLLCRLIKSSAFTDDERKAVQGMVARGLSKLRATDVIDRTMTTLKERKAATSAIKAIEEEEEELALDDARPRKRSPQEAGV